jgi:hypothetical protein
MFAGLRTWIEQMTKNAGNIKILNLDTLPTKSPKRQITLKGVTYDVLEMSVESFIETNQAAERLDGVTDLQIQLNETIASIQRAVPDVPEAELRKIPLEKLGTLASFIRGMFDPDAADITGIEPPAGEAGAEKK